MILDDAMRTAAYRREVAGFPTRGAYFVARSRRQANASGVADMQQRAAITIVNGLEMRVPRGSRLRSYHEWP